MTRSILLLAGTAAAALIAGRAGAQAFQGTHVVTAGAATRILTGPTTETVQIESPSAILTWAPSDSAIGGPAIDFLPAGNVATFQNGPNNASFMVLNRIVPKDPSRAIQLNGTVISQLKTAAGTVRGGTVAFYSPGGILVGAKAVIDVGSLLLTTIDPKADAVGNFFIANSYSLTGAVDPKSKVSIAAGAQLSARNEGSYIAVAAPIVEQHGTVSVNGTAAYVAAESVVLTINNGLFDIQVATGSSSATNTLVHDGTTGGPASTGAGDNHRIYLVAVPKNQAITALLQGNVGFAAASSAAVSNGEIILSAGRSVTSADAFKPAAPTPAASFRIQGGNLTSDVLGSATADFVVDAANGNVGFSGNADLTGDLNARVDPAAGRSVDVAGNVALRSDGTPLTRSPGLDNVGGNAGIAATGATVTVGGNVVLSAIGLGGFEESGSIAGNGTGGLATVSANGGTVTIKGNLSADASGTGGTGSKLAVGGGTGTGGLASISADTGTVSVLGTTSLLAGGTGAPSGAPAAAGPTGTGGTAILSVGTNGNIKLTGAALLAAAGTGGSLDPSGAGKGGTGTGGGTLIRAVGGSVALSSAAQLSAPGFGGAGPSGGAGTGGQAAAETATGGTIAFGAAASLAADGKGAAAGGPGGSGGAGTGGLAQAMAHNGAGSLISGAGVTASADGVGGAGAGGPAGGGFGGAGGAGTGGVAQLVAESDSGKLTFAASAAHANGTGGAGGAGVADGGGGAGGGGLGGKVVAGTISAQPGNAISGSATFAALLLDARATGGAGGAAGAAAPGGNGGDVTGGTVDLFSRGAPAIVTGSAILNVSATAGTAGTGAGGAGGIGAASGGTLTVGANRDDFGHGPGSLKVGSLDGTANAIAGGGNDNRPGSWQVIADNGDVQLGSFALTASSTGAPAVRPASAFTLNAGTVTVAGAGTATSGGDLNVAATGNAQLKGGSLALAAPFGAILVTHSARPAGLATIDAASLSAVSSGAFTAAPGTRLATTGATAITAGGAIQVDQAAAGTSFTAATPLTITLTGAAGGQTMNLRSSDIVVGNAATLGSATTQTVQLGIAGNGSPAVIGGGSAAGAGGYTLDAAEVGRVRTAQLSIQAPATSADPTREADVYLRGMTLSGSDGGNGLAGFALATPGRVQVDGQVSYLNAAAGDTLAITAGERIQLLVPSGALLLSNQAGRPGGTLALAARDIWATDAANLAHLQVDPSVSDVPDSLAANHGAVNAQGYLQANTVSFTSGRSLYVQNSGTLADFAGITVGPGGLHIRAAGAAPIDVVAFGRQQNADGSFTTNLAFYALVDFGKGAGTSYTDRSQFNRCNINKGCPPPPGPPAPPPVVDPGPGQVPNPPGLPPPPPVPPAPPVLPPAPVARQVPLVPDVRSAAFLLGPLFVPQLPPLDLGQLIDAAFAAEPLIEEPVTSGGDSTAWTGEGKPRRDK